MPCVRRLLVLTTLLAGCAGTVGRADPAAAVWAKVPLSVTTATVKIELKGPAGPDVASGSGALPLTVPFNATNKSCGADGTVTVSAVDGGIQLEADGTLSAPLATSDCD